MDVKKSADNIQKVIIGKDKVIDIVITALICGGHALLEDVPGTGKTIKACQVYAAINGRTFVNPDDVKILATYVFANRLLLKNTIRIKGISSETMIKEILSKVEVPTEVWNH